MYENVTFRGHKAPKEHRWKMSGGVKRAWAEGKYANRPSRKGIPHTEEEKRKISLAARGPNHKNPFHKGHHITPLGFHVSPATEFKKGDPRLKEIGLRGRMKQIFPKRATTIELAMRQALDKRGINYIVNSPVLGICQPDIVIFDKKAAIFCDGDYWHNLPSYIARDARQNEALTKAGWKVLRFWEHEINSNVDGCTNRVMGVVI